MGARKIVSYSSYWSTIEFPALFRELILYNNKSITIIIMKKTISILVILKLCISAYSQDEGDKHPILTDNFIIELGWFSPSENVDLSVSGTTDLGIEDIEDIDFDEQLGLSGGNNTFNMHFKWRFSKSNLWYMTGEYFGVSPEKTITISEEIEWEDVVYPVGGEATLGYSLSLYRIFFGRVISRGQKHELGAGLGIHGVNTKAFVEGNAFIDDQAAGFQRQEESIFLPLPNIGAAYTWAPTARWAFFGRVDWFGIKIDNISGGLWNVSPGVTFMIVKHFGITGSYQFINFNADIDQDNWQGGFDLSFGGPSVRLVGHF